MAIGCPRALSGGMMLAVALAGAAPAAAQQVQITRLADFAFGTVGVDADISSSKDVCISSSGVLGRYNVVASGSGTNRAFTLAGAGAPLAYEVQWSGTPGRATGTALVAGMATTGLTTTGLGLNLGCVLGNDSASLIVLMRSSELSKATAGPYTGTLTLLIAAE
ncbi:hypothetical protein [Sphingomonas sp. 2SG]|uniref:hypothetical protein n=1 Tax=Sphingomonas sp. 2SG TaxID=2502201 RepID=UPI0014853E94|nr:hypothetical protein [Sphingomonas sp. 2SG]